MSDSFDESEDEDTSDDDDAFDKNADLLDDLKKDESFIESSSNKDRSI